MIDTYIVDSATKVEQHGLGELAAVDGVVLAELLARDRSLVDVEDHLAVVGARLEHVSAERDKVVERRQHLYVHLRSLA